MRIACAGGGALGASAALLLAHRLPKARICVIDPQTAVRSDRTFVIGGSVWDSWQAEGVWDGLAERSNGLSRMSVTFADTFGSLSLAADDCMVESFSRTVSERDFLDFSRSKLAAQENVELLDAKITDLSAEGTVEMRVGEKIQSRSFDLVVVTGIPESLIEAAGFRFSRNRYALTALASTLAGPQTGSGASMLYLNPAGLSVSVPRRGDSWGHILLLPSGRAESLVNMDDSQYLGFLYSKKWLPFKEESEIAGRYVFSPQRSIAHPAASKRLILIGGSACTVSPVGAQGLNLGLRDADVLSALLADSVDLDGVAAEFSLLRKVERSRIAQMTDLVTRVVEKPLPGKLKLMGLAATAADMLPPARRAILAQATLRRT